MIELMKWQKNYLLYELFVSSKIEDPVDADSDEIFPKIKDSVVIETLDQQGAKQLPNPSSRTISLAGSAGKPVISREIALIGNGKILTSKGEK